MLQRVNSGQDINGPDTAGLAVLNNEVDRCRLCADRGYVAIPRPIERGRGALRFWLIGQAPGLGEGTRKVAFGGPAGRTLMKWFGQAGLSEEQVRTYFYLSAINKCYPGRAAGGGGDRNPSPLERALCRPFLLREMALLRPRLVVLVGSTAIKEIYGDKIRLEEIIGRRMTLASGDLYDRLELRLRKAKAPGAASLREWFDPAAPVELYHLPHPSGASTWLNLPQNKALLEQALSDLREKFSEVV